MQATKTKRKKILSGISERSDKIDENASFMDETEALEKATDSVVSDLPERKRKKYERKNWGDRPEHLRKPLGEMTSDEKAEYYKWKSGDLNANEIKKKIAYEETEIYAIGCFLLPVLCARLPNPLPPTEEELRGFSRIMTPLANKYLREMKYKEEINAAFFALVFITPRLKKESILSNSEYSG